MPTATALTREFTPANRRRAYRFVAEPTENQAGTKGTVISARQLAQMQAQINRLQHMVRAQASTIDMLYGETRQDALTGLTNRRGFDEALRMALTDSERYGYKGALITIDLNYFKQVNDTFGHAAGDALLVHMSRLLTQVTRATDLKARLGGDEFAIMLKEASAAAANAKAHQLAELFDQNPCFFNGKAIALSASLGVASFHESNDMETLCRLADERMYAAKQVAHADVTTGK